VKKTNKIETKVADIPHETTQIKHIFGTLHLYSLYTWHVSCITRKCTKDLLYSTDRKKWTEVVSPTRGVVRVVFHKFVATTWNNLYISLVEGEMPRGTTPFKLQNSIELQCQKARDIIRTEGFKDTIYPTSQDAHKCTGAMYDLILACSQN
jgi:hypothetical protein